MAPRWFSWLERRCRPRASGAASQTPPPAVIPDRTPGSTSSSIRLNSASPASGNPPSSSMRRRGVFNERASPDRSGRILGRIPPEGDRLGAAGAARRRVTPLGSARHVALDLNAVPHHLPPRDRRRAVSVPPPPGAPGCSLPAVPPSSPASTASFCAVAGRHSSVGPGPPGLSSAINARALAVSERASLWITWKCRRTRRPFSRTP
jgi:hypothetical protein